MKRWTHIFGGHQIEEGLALEQKVLGIRVAAREKNRYSFHARSGGGKRGHRREGKRSGSLGEQKKSAFYFCGEKEGLECQNTINTAVVSKGGED